jgi:RNA polymerase sigma-70 factor (ECF subfamily)
MPPSQGEVTVLLRKLSQGSKEAEAELLGLLYKELRRIAGYYMRLENPDHTLQPTALVHEAYLRLTDQTRVDWKDRSHFLGVAAQLMRRILVDHARERVAARRGGAYRVRLPIENVEIPDLSQQEQVLAVHEALARLQKFDPQQERVVEMRYFGGLTVAETADVLGISPRTVKRDWAMAVAWLRAEFAAGSAHDDA